MKSTLSLIFIFIGLTAYSQVRISIAGDVRDAATGDPLAYATVGVKNRVEQTSTNAQGQFQLVIEEGADSDTLVVTYIGYGKFEKRVAKLASFERIVLREYATVLDEVVIEERKFDPRDLDRTLRQIRGNIYACDAEVSNLDYNNFLAAANGDVRKKSDFNLNKYDKSVRDYYQRYQKPSKVKRSRRDTVSNFNDYPAVNISYEGALAYCNWLTEEYNGHPKKKKFKKVLFRLPTLDEWQIAALGYPKFQSWTLMDNIVEVTISKDTMDAMKGPREKMKMDETILYPWFNVYHMRNRVWNQWGCYLGNFNVTTDRHCPARAGAYDGFTMMAFGRAYFPNDIGLYDVVGNVAEMIDEKGKACGGSWKDAPEKSTIRSVKNYSGPDETVGFRVFMEVIEK